MDSISVFVFHVRKVFVPVVTGKITGTFFLGHPVHNTYMHMYRRMPIFYIGPYGPP